MTSCSSPLCSKNYYFRPQSSATSPPHPPSPSCALTRSSCASKAPSYSMLFSLLTFIESVSAYSLFSLLWWTWDCFIVKNVDRKSLWFVRFSVENYAKYSCFKAFYAVILSFGSYIKSLVRMSLRSLGHPLGRNLSSPIPFLGGKFISICDACALNLSWTSGCGVPNILWILLTWSSSSLPGNRGFLVMS